MLGAAAAAPLAALPVPRPAEPEVVALLRRFGAWSVGEQLSFITAATVMLGLFMQGVESYEPIYEAVREGRPIPIA